MNNCGQFRAVRDISLKPIIKVNYLTVQHRKVLAFKGELETLIKRMDLGDGVTHRGNDFVGEERKKRKDRKPTKNKLAHFARKISSKLFSFAICTCISSRRRHWSLDSA